MRVLVIGGTGTVGSLIVPALLERGVAVRVLTRSPGRAAALPTAVEPVVGDIMENPEACAVAFRDVDAVFMLNAATAHESVEGLLAVEIARAAGVRRFVYQSVHNVEAWAHIPHVAAKLLVERALGRSTMGYTLIRPNHFFQNDGECRMTLFDEGHYVQPVGPIGCWRVDARDIAESAVIALTEDGHQGETYNLVGPENLTGADCAAAWSRALGRTIRYREATAAWLDGVKHRIPAWLAFDIHMMHREIGALGMPAAEADVARVTGLLGHPPRAYQSYVNEQAAAWRQ